MTYPKKLLKKRCEEKCGERIFMTINIVNLLSKAFMSNNVQKSTALTHVSNNPFANPFVTPNNRNNNYSYAKNNPVQGGYFAGYYNGKSNIVGQRLFVEA